jgi:hypothetical protein
LLAHSVVISSLTLYRVKLAQLWSCFCWKDFYSCSGDKLDAIDGQIQRINGKKVDLVTLSISGNDFFFGDVVVSLSLKPKVDYNTLIEQLLIVILESLRTPKNQSTPGMTYQQACDAAIKKSNDAVANDANWTTYRSVIADIKSKALNENGRLLITGYAKFFADGARTQDICDGTQFLDIFGFRNNLAMRAANSVAMNDGVDEVNRRIQADVVNVVNDRAVQLIDVDPLFNGNRFCEPANGNNPKGVNPDNPEVWFYDIDSTLDETGAWNPPAGQENLATHLDLSPTKNATHGTESLIAIGPTLYQQSFCFHPKTGAGASIADKIFWYILHTTPE